MVETLYKRTAIGLYTIEITHSSTIGGGTIISKYGLINGSKVSNITKGDAKKFTALVKKKRQEGYKSFSDLGATNIEELNLLLPVYNTDANSYFKSMKCQKFIINKFDYSNGAFGQPKINGNRATITYAMSNDGLFSRMKPIIRSHEGIVLNIKHIENVFDKIFKNCPKDTVFDGEIYCYGEPVTSISGAAKNMNNPIHKNLQYKCFDLAIPDIDQGTRLSMKHSYLKRAEFPGEVAIQKHISEHQKLRYDIVVDVCDVIIENDEEACILRDDCIKAGYEGCVIRNSEATYKFGSRPSTMMKLKKAKHGFFEVIEIHKFGDTSDNNVGVGCKFILKNDIDNSLFECNCVGTVEERLNYYNNRKRYIGTKVAVKYFERTVNGLPFHANVIPNEDNPVVT